MSWFIPQTAAGILLAGNLYASAAVGLMSNFNYKKKNGDMRFLNASPTYVV